MRNILIPTDFSPNARQAFRYGLELAEELNAAITVIHYCKPGPNAVREPHLFDLDDLVQAKKQMLETFVAEADPESSVDNVVKRSLRVSTEVRAGFAAEELVKVSKTGEVDLIIMGTTGEAGWLKKVFGSVSSEVSQYAECPVLLVPPEAFYNGVENILYASNYEAIRAPILQQIIDLAEAFTANIHLVHVNENKNKGDFMLEELVLEKLLQKNVPAAFLSIKTVHSETVWQGLYEEALLRKADLLVMVTRRRKFWEAIRHQSQTKSMLRHSPIPMLILHTQD